MNWAQGTGNQFVCWPPATRKELVPADREITRSISLLWRCSSALMDACRQQKSGMLPSLSRSYPSMTFNGWEQLKRRRGWKVGTGSDDDFRFSLFPFRNLIHTQDRISHSLNIKAVPWETDKSHWHLRAAATQPWTGNLSNWEYLND